MKEVAVSAKIVVIANVDKSMDCSQNFLLNINYIHKEFMTRLYSRNVPYHLVQKILSSHFLPKN